MRRVAHIVQNPYLLGSPPNEAFLAAYQSLGYEVDLYSTWSEDQTHIVRIGINLKSIEFSQRWILKNVFRPVWRRYAIFSATTEDPLAPAGLLSQLWQRPLITLADEIRNDSYSGNRSKRWKDLCRWGMRRSSLTVVNEIERVDIQRQYAGLPAEDPVIVYPGCFRKPPPPMDRFVVRRTRGLPDEALVVCYSGLFSKDNGGLWLAKAISDAPRDVWFWGQLVGQDALARGLLKSMRGSERLVLENDRLSWADAWASMGGADIGVVVYLQDAPQFRHMGTASNRLCMFLAMGVPVIASRQPSFEFVEQYDCGVLVENEDEFVAAIGRIAARLGDMKANSLRCAREYIDAPGKFEILKQRLSQL